MQTRRQVLGATALSGAGFLAGCGVLGGSDDSESYPEGVPEPDALDGTQLTHASRYDLAAMRDHADVFSADCGGSVLECSLLQYDAVATGRWVLDLEDVETLIAGGRHTVNAHPRSLASSAGVHAFKIYEYTADGSTVQSALEDRYNQLSSAGPFQYYGQDSEAGAGIADDGNRLVVGIPGVTEVVAERLQGEHESFDEAVPDRATARDHLGTTSAELIGTSHEPDEDDPDWHADRTIVATGVEFGDTVTYRSAQVFGSEDAPSSVSDEAVQSWATNQFEPVAFAGLDGVSTFDIERTGRSIVVTASIDEYVGLF